MISAYSTSSTVKTSENDFSQLHGQCPNVRIWKIVFIKDGQFHLHFVLKFERLILAYKANIQMLILKNELWQIDNTLPMSKC